MCPFIAFAWIPPNRRASLAVATLRCSLERAIARWEPAFESDGMIVFSRASRVADLRAYRLPARGGVILGRLFPSDLDDYGPEWEPDIREDDVTRYLNTSGRELTKDYWGAYLAFLTNPADIHHLIVRDPSGKLPCYRLRHEEVDILFADVGDLISLPLPPLTPNLRYLAAAIHCSSLQIRHTALEQVTELLAGEGFEQRGPSRRQEIVWDPRRATEGTLESSIDGAAGRLRRVTQACIDAWASVHTRIIHRLSGGLDSSIVLGCLSRAPSSPALVCLNSYVDDEEGDEREYARIAAAYTHARLIEIAADPGAFAFDERLLAMPPSLKPSFSQCARLLHLGTINREVELHRANAVWTGQGGDHLFLKASNIPSAPDFVSDRGMRWELVRVVRDEARRSALPYAWVLESALGAARSRNDGGRPPPRDRVAHFIDPDALPRDLERYSAHPWAASTESLPPGRQRQISLLADIVNRHRPLQGLERAYEHHPLLSQPIIEQCLRTPTYLHLEGGRHRSLARYAFRDCVPQQILEREDKGATTQLTVESIRRSERFLCELLLDGILARERVFARDQLESCLRDGRALKTTELPPLLGCIAAEVWIRAWHNATRAPPPVRRE
jgi:asparagine synthase (glutamine-hydrolysing)